MKHCITVVHLMRHPDCYRVDRASALGNPFDLGSEDQRPIVAKAHKEYLWEMIRKRIPPDRDKEPIEAAAIILARYPELTLARAWKRPTRAEFMVHTESIALAKRRGDGRAVEFGGLKLTLKNDPLINFMRVVFASANLLVANLNRHHQMSGFGST